MIGRYWRGWTSRENADAYAALLKEKVLPGIHRHEGYRGAYAMRRDAGAEVECATLTFWDSWDAVRGFAGDDPETAVVPAEARALLSRFDAKSLHYEILESPY